MSSFNDKHIVQVDCSQAFHKAPICFTHLFIGTEQNISLLDSF